MRIYIYTFLLLLVIPLAGFAQATGNMSKIHVISYNIWNGFEKDTQRRTNFINWVKSQDPEIMAMTELCGFTEKELKELAASYGHPYVAIVKEEGYPVGISSKEPIEVVTKQLEGLWHGLLHVKTYDMDVIVTHLSPFDWKFRLSEAEWITQYIRNRELKDYMIMGDFNAYTPFDAEWVETHTVLKERMQKWDSEQKEYRNMRDNQFDYSVLSKFLSIGMADICRLYVPAEKRTTFPTAFLYGWKHDDERIPQIGERLDYILVSPSVLSRCTNASIHNTIETEGISDHYPVSVDIR